MTHTIQITESLIRISSTTATTVIVAEFLCIFSYLKPDVLNSVNRLYTKRDLPLMLYRLPESETRYSTHYQYMYFE